jgi:virulence factor
MSEKIRVAFIGAGLMANLVHYPSVYSFEDVEIVGICDLNARALQETADKYGIRNRYTDYRTMVEELKPQAVYVIGSPHIMFDIWIWCLGKGLHVYIEKPLGITLHQAQMSAYLAEKNGCITQVGFQRRSNPMVTLLREECLKRGPITHAVCRYYKSTHGPFMHSLDHMLNDGVHAIDTVRWMCGGEVVKIESVTKRIHTPDINFISAALHFDNGAIGHVLCNWRSGRRIFEVEMHAPNICAEADHENKGYLFEGKPPVEKVNWWEQTNVKGVEYDAREVAGGSEFYQYGGFLAKHREFIDALKTGKQASSHFGDALKTMEVAQKILAQSLLDNGGIISHE